MKPLLYALPGNEGFAKQLADALGADSGVLDVHTFPDGETRVRFETPPAGRDVVLVCTLNDPNPKTPPLLFASATARELGARTVGLVAPYLCYMRQDQRFRPGEALTADLFARLLSSHFDWLVTVDPHLHRYRSLAEVYTIPTAAVSAATPIAAFIRASVPRPLLIGPDSESAQWVASVAEQVQAPFTVLSKRRHGDREVEVSLPEVERWRGHTPVLVDDIVSSGRTLIAAIRQLKAAALAPPVCIGIHAVFGGSAFAELATAGASRVATVNTIAHESNAIDIVPSVADGVLRLTSLAASQPSTA